MFGKKKKDEFNFYTNDLIIIFDHDNKTSTIEQINYIKDDTIYVTGKHAIPLNDCTVTNSEGGRNFFLRAPSNYITETKRLAQLEKNMVLTQITSYKPPVLPSSMDWTKALLFALVFVAFIVVAFL